VLAYLSRYTHRIAIANSRLVAFDGERVTFKWKDYRAKADNRYKLMTLDVDEFIRRFLIHVLPDGFHRIRHHSRNSMVSRGGFRPFPNFFPRWFSPITAPVYWRSRARRSPQRSGTRALSRRSGFLRTRRAPSGNLGRGSARSCRSAGSKARRQACLKLEEISIFIQRVTPSVTERLAPPC
jgi:hypothetical protein